MRTKVFIARQPILDRNKKLFAYELLFRRKQDEVQISVIDDMEATSQVLDNAINNIGTEKLVGSNLAFVNCSYEMLTSDILFILDPKIFILEILETVEIDDCLVESVKKLHEKGYTIAIDDFIPSIEELKRILPVLKYTRIVKLEFPKIQVPDVETTVRTFHSKNIMVLAEKIETEADYNIALKAGCDYFQGYFFAKPENIGTSKLDVSALDTFNLLKSVEEGLEINQLEAEFKRQSNLSVNLIKYLNSAHFAIRTKITSIRHAISMLGYDNLKRWLLILAYANKQGNLVENSPLLNNAIQRGILFEEITKHMNMDKSQCDKAYLMGLISHLDALYKLPMESILEQLQLDEEITKALINNEGSMGELLNLAKAIEKDDVSQIQSSMETLSVSMENLNSALLKAYESKEL